MSITTPRPTAQLVASAEPRAAVGAADEHWAPPQLVLARRRLTLVGALSVARAADGSVLTRPGAVAPAAACPAAPSPSAAAPAWQRGPFGRIWSVRPVPAAPGVFALVEQGSVRYVGQSGDLARTFSRAGLGEVSRRDAAAPADAEWCRLNHLVVEAAAQGRTVDLYVLTTGPAVARGLGPALRGLVRGRPEPAAPARWDPTELAEQIRRAVTGTWQPGLA